MIPGDRFGMLVVRELLTSRQSGHFHDGRWARCRCDCGKRVMVRARHLRRGAIKTCGTRTCTDKLFASLARKCKYCERVLAIWGVGVHEAAHRRREAVSV